MEPGGFLSQGGGTLRLHQSLRYKSAVLTNIQDQVGFPTVDSPSTLVIHPLRPRRIIESASFDLFPQGVTLILMSF